MSDEITTEQLSDSIAIGGEQITISPLNAKKTAFIMNLLGRLLITGKIRLKEIKGSSANDLPLAILAAVDEENLVQLASVVIDKDATFVTENFSLSWVLEALLIQVRVGELDKIIRNFTSLVTQIA